MADRYDEDLHRREQARTGPLGLVGDALEHVTALVRKELDLFRAELQENTNKAFAAVGMIIGGVVLLLVALNVLAAAFVAWLTAAGISAGWSSLIVFGVLAVIALILLLTGRSNLRAASLAPTRTTKNLRRDAQTLKEATQNG
ncbi:phage holin family protein [Roseicyclus sp.]|uniref:phage holin family protein n=1 Tax=Roseicyclus sp. TaxID=1914329 RepID=UPI003F9ECC55